MRRGLAVAALLASGCFTPPDLPPPEPVDLAPAEVDAGRARVDLDPQSAGPMYRELVAVDLPTVVRVAAAQNLEVQGARERVAAQKARLQSATGWLFPTLSPALLYERVDGTVRATEGNLVGVGFETLQPDLLAQWFVNPGKVVYEIVAARKRVVASQYLERSTVLATVQSAALQYYDLVLAQVAVAAARQAVTESRELLRITRSRRRVGNALPGDELRTRADLAGREQDLLHAIGSFNKASVELAQTLDLDPTVTLAPSGSEVVQTTLVRAETTVDELLAIAVSRRDDLEAVRVLVAASSADTAATWWGALGPRLGASYRYGGISGHADDVGALGGNVSGSKEQRRLTAGAGFDFGLASFGLTAAASVAERQAALDAAQKLASVRAQVVGADQDRKLLTELVSHAAEELAAAVEALRLAKASLQAGTMTRFDVLCDESALARARLRHAETVVRFNQAQIDLLAALGILTADLLASAP